MFKHYETDEALIYRKKPTVKQNNKITNWYMVKSSTWIISGEIEAKTTMKLYYSPGSVSISKRWTTNDEKGCEQRAFVLRFSLKNHCQDSISTRIDQEGMFYTHYGILFSHKKDGILSFVPTWLELEDVMLSQICQAYNGRIQMSLLM